ncbi:MAG: hypothetical protein K0S42_2749 [Microvirga sp.]|jgi:hypothetical protein|nr:hypothetical protein [Microvirga sp.]
MSYEEAKDCFQENMETIGVPPTDRIAWNLSAGLHKLATAIEADLQRLHSRLDDIGRRLKEAR